MYSEQLMREQGFDDAPNFRLNMYTDAIWRAVRIILDVRMHRGEISVKDAIRFMVDETSFEEANARAEVHRYTYTPSYQLSYLLGKVLLLQLRSDEQRRLGNAFGQDQSKISHGAPPSPPPWHPPQRPSRPTAGRRGRPPLRPRPIRFPPSPRSGPH